MAFHLAFREIRKAESARLDQTTFNVIKGTLNTGVARVAPGRGTVRLPPGGPYIWTLALPSQHSLTHSLGPGENRPSLRRAANYFVTTPPPNDRVLGREPGFLGGGRTIIRLSTFSDELPSTRRWTAVW